ncbi:hypothetical protein C4571_03745 [Candidatus Parcubacteria bacterium]|nr:MAG: hypothetical protein C4571_03745 [Candidatus Parcubacteria bacterium]
MKLLFFVPTYWARPSAEGHQEGDEIYDHPTPADTEGTLERTLRSFQLLRDQEWSIVVGIATTIPAVTEKAYQQVKKVIERLDEGLREKINVVGSREVDNIRLLFSGENIGQKSDLFLFRGYPGIRNLGLVTGTASGADIVVMVDDDQVFEDPDFVGKIREGFQAKIQGEELHAWSGFCPEQNGSYIRVRSFEPWMKYWDKIRAQNETYEKIIGVPHPRWKITPLAFGGCFILKRETFMKIPFDPSVGRGEDMDYLMNARMFGVTFYLDNQLAMTHLPPARIHPQWQRIRQDMVRFLYQREKIARQTDRPGMTRVEAEDFLPYPGTFLRKDLDDKIRMTNRALVEMYTSQGNLDAVEEARKNLEIADQMIFKADPFAVLLQVQEEWKLAAQLVDKNKVTLQNLLSLRG